MASKGNRQKIEALQDVVSIFTNLADGYSEIADYAVKQFGYKTIEYAKAYLRGDREPYGVTWPALWESEKGRGLYQWTPEFYPVDKFVEGSWLGRENHVRQEKRNEDHPLDDTGRLADSLRVLYFNKSRQASQAQIMVGSKLPYAALMEFGGANPWYKKDGTKLNDIPARPYLFPAINAVKNDRSFKEALKKEIVKAVKDSIKGKTKLRLRDFANRE